MIKHLSGDFETVEYDTKKYAMLYDNVENEPYPVHWHNAVEFVMPLKNEYTVKVKRNRLQDPRKRCSHRSSG